MQRKGYTTENAIDIFNKYGYEYIDGNVSNNIDKIIVKSKEGYLYYSNIQCINKTGHIRPFDKSNPYTIENIKTFLKNNNSNIEVLENEFISNSYKMKWKCSCGNIFTRKWNNVLHSKVFKCPKCSLSDKKINNNKINNILNDKKLKIINNETYVNSMTPISVINEDGYKAKVCITSIIRNDSILWFSVKNIYTIDNINTVLRNNNFSF